MLVMVPTYVLWATVNGKDIGPLRVPRTYLKDFLAVLEFNGADRVNYGKETEPGIPAVTETGDEA